MRRSRFTSFSESLGASLAPLLAPLNDSNRLAEDQDSGATLPGSRSVRSIRSILEEALVEASQRRPHILVAGPPKSGKSTLITALARSYVTKVSDLPGLPVPVRVLHAPTWSLTLVRNDGSSDTYRDPSSARVEIKRAHRAWVEALREAQAGGVEFDAHLLAPRAAERIELETPVEGLKASRIALVEFPSLSGLSSSARERMLAQFAEEASTTVLVVRTEDLSRPQELAALESFIAHGQSAFLVLNLDPDKVDLGPTGEGLTTLDSEDPVAVIEAFQSLGASRAWMDAFDNGRLRVHLAPLYDIAAARLEQASLEQSRTHSVQMAAGRRLKTPRPDQHGDALVALEDELDASLHEGVRWRAHVHETLRGVEAMLDELQGALDQADQASDQSSIRTADEPPSLDEGRLALQRARTAMRQIRVRHLPVE